MQLTIHSPNPLSLATSRNELSPSLSLVRTRHTTARRLHHLRWPATLASRGMSSEQFLLQLLNSLKQELVPELPSTCQVFLEMVPMRATTHFPPVLQQLQISPLAPSPLAEHYKSQLLAYMTKLPMQQSQILAPCQSQMPYLQIFRTCRCQVLLRNMRTRTSALGRACQLRLHHLLGPHDSITASP